MSFARHLRTLPVPPPDAKEPPGESRARVMARAALSVVFNQGRDDEVAELRRRLAQLEQDAAGESARRMADCWETLCQAGISLQGAQVRSLVERFIERTRWGVAPGVQYADGTPVPPGPFNLASNRNGDFLHLESVLIGYMEDDFLTGNWRPLPEYLQLVQESGFFRLRPGGLFERFHVTAAPRLYDEFYDESESESEL